MEIYNLRPFGTEFHKAKRENSLLSLCKVIKIRTVIPAKCHTFCVILTQNNKCQVVTHNIKMSRHFKISHVFFQMAIKSKTLITPVSVVASCRYTKI